MLKHPHLDVNAIRAQFPITQNITYLNTGWSGPSPIAVVAAATDLLKLLSEEGPTTPWVLQLLNETETAARVAFARLLAAPADTITLTSNTTHGLNMVLSGMTWHAGDEVVTTNQEHPSGLVPLYQFREHRGMGVGIVSLSAVDDEATILAKLEAAITPRTRLLLLSHILFTNGLRLPIAAINAMAHRHNVQVLVDGAQTAGHIPLDVVAWDCDYYAVPAHKWLMGPGGVGALYIRKELLPGLVPAHVTLHGALSYDAAGNFTPAPESAKKFELTTSNGALLASAVAAIEFIEEQGLEAIQARWEELTTYTRSGLEGVPGVTVTSPSAGPTASALVTFTVDGWEPQPLVQALWERGNIVARFVLEPPNIRVSLALFNNEQEVDHLLATLRTIVSENRAG